MRQINLAATVTVRLPYDGVGRHTCDLAHLTLSA
jgi:hypothetical protein